MNKKILILILFLIAISALVYSEVFTGEIRINEGDIIKEDNSEKSIIYYLKVINIGLINPLNKIDDDGVQDGTTKTTPKGVSQTNGIISTSASVIVSEKDYSGSKYYLATFKKGFSKDSDYFCLDFPDKFIPSYQVNHGKYCFFIRDWDVEDGKIINVHVLTTRAPITAGDKRVEVDCSYTFGWNSARISALSSLLQPGESETYGCDLQNISGLDNIYEGITLNFPTGITQNTNGDFSFYMSISLQGDKKYPQ